MADGATKEFSISNDDILTFNITGKGSRLIHLFENSFSKADQYIMCAIETEDCQIDFTRLYFWSRDISKGDLEFF